jgi:hypothetical protein
MGGGATAAVWGVGWARRERTRRERTGREDRKRETGRIIKIGRRITKLGTREMFGRDEKMMA